MTARTFELNKHGFEVIRFTNEQILHDSDNVLNEILVRLKKENPKLSESRTLLWRAGRPPLGGQGGRACFYLLPGVPHEMKGLMMDEVIPRLLKEL